MSMKLYGVMGSNNVRRAYAVALHLDLPVEHIDLFPRTPAADTPEFRRMSPAGRVPAFSDGDFVTDESHAIMLYLAEAKPNTLWPGDRKLRAQVMRWMSWSLAHWSAGYGPVQYERVIKPFILKAAARSGGDRSGHADLSPGSEAAGHSPYGQAMAGRLRRSRSRISAWLQGLSYAGPAKFPLEPYPNIREWYSRIEALPAWQKTAPKLG